ncbi:class I SAM-dependent methyltransferase [Desulfovibrio sp. OttesenSCG-928-M14]|nr:class I SAM-dependent methyltransferase [Desulfovibrio sp. OttesenSCG-928-M14]
MSIPQAKKKICSLIELLIPNATELPLSHLDVGAGSGGLIKKFQQHFKFDSQACDFYTERFQLPSIKIQQTDFNNKPLPYQNDSFDLVTSAEVVEHLENYRYLLREIYRILKPGGVFIVTTPNVLNLKSRFRYYICGFANLFGPISVKMDNHYTTGSHITPIPYFYLAHGMLDAGFSNLILASDKRQKSSLLLLALTWPLLLPGRLYFQMDEKRRGNITQENKRFIDETYSLDILLGRTVIIAATKPDKDAPELKAGSL